jgi:hypothetical protein
MIGSLILVDRNRLSDQLGGGFTASAPICDHPEQMQAVRMLGVGFENLAVNPFGLGQPPRLVVPKRISEHALNNPSRGISHHINESATSVFFLFEKTWESTTVRV